MHFEWPPYLIAETAFHHEGDLSYLLRLVDAAANAGADAVKFQILLSSSDFIAPSHSSREKLTTFMFEEGQWSTAIRHAQDVGLEIVVMPLEPVALQFCLAVCPGFSFAEIHPVLFNDTDFLRSFRGCPGNVALGIGGRFQEEVDEAIKANDYISALVHGFQAFPTDIRDSNLKRIAEIRSRYGRRVWFADHSPPRKVGDLCASTVAWLLGADIVERHITCKSAAHKVDSESAISVDEFRAMKMGFDEIIGEGVWSLSDAEVRYGQRDKKVVARRAIRRGEIVGLADIDLLMTDTSAGLTSKALADGRLAASDIALGAVIIEQMLQ